MVLRDDSLSIAFRWIGATLFAGPIGFYLTSLIIVVSAIFEPGMLNHGSDPLTAIALGPLMAFIWSPLFVMVVAPTTGAFAIGSEFIHQLWNMRRLPGYTILAAAIGAIIGIAMHATDLNGYWSCAELKACGNWQSYTDWAQSCLHDGGRDDSCGATNYSTNLIDYSAAAGWAMIVAALIGAIFWLIRRPDKDNRLLRPQAHS